MSPALRWLASFLFVAAAGLAAYQIVTLRLADQWAQSDPARALRWRPAHPGALLALAEQQLARGRHVQAAATARRLLGAEPLEGRAWRVLAESEAALGHAMEAERLYRIAVRRAPRDRKARVALLQVELQSQRGAAAIEHLDVLLRMTPAQAEPLLALLIELAAVDPLADEIAKRLTLDPPWRPGLVRALQANPTTPAAHALLGAMSRSGVLTTEERALWVAGLMKQGHWGEAYARWASTPKVRGRPLEPVFNGRFEEAGLSGAFDWRLEPPPGVDLGIEASDDRGGAALKMAFHGRRIGAVGLEQTLMLVPGGYRMSFRARVTHLESDRGIEWALGCEGQGASFAQSPKLREQGGWTDWTFDFEVPTESCPAQWLRVRNAATAPPLQRLQGEVWLDDIRIVRRPPSLVVPQSEGYPRERAGGSTPI